MSGIQWGSSEQAFKAIWEKLCEIAPHLPNRGKKFTVNLSTARTDMSLVEEGLMPSGKTFWYLIVFKVGSGVWSLKMKLSDGSFIEYSSTDLSDGYMMERRFVDVLFTNTSQTVGNPEFIVEWNE